MANRCGLVSGQPLPMRGISPARVCHGLLEPDRSVWAGHPRVQPCAITWGSLEEAAGELDAVEQVAAIYRSDPRWLMPSHFLECLTDTAPALCGAD